MIVSGSLGILFNPDTVYAIEKNKGKYDIIAENECHKICLYRDLKESEVKNIMGRITFQIECQVFKDED